MSKKSKFLKTLTVFGTALAAPFLLTGCMGSTENNVDFRVYNGYIQTTTDGTNWENFIALEDIKGEDGTDGIQYTIGADGYWYLNGIKTNNKAIGTDGDAGSKITSITKDTTNSTAEKTIYIIELEDGTKYPFEVVNGTNGKDGTDGITPTISISDDGYWIINGSKTDKKAIGTDGSNGEDGTDADVWTIGADGYWYKNGNVTEYKAIGTDGENGKDGSDGISYYVHIKYADNNPTSNSDMKTTPSSWIGIYSGTSKTAPTTYSSYTWYCIKGDDGEDTSYTTYTITYEYGAAKDFFTNAIDSQEIKSTEWISSLPILKSEYKNSFLGWFIENTNKKLDEFDFVGGNVTLEARFNVDTINVAGIYSTNGKFLYNWDYITTNYPSKFNGTELVDGKFTTYGQIIISNTITSIADSAFSRSAFSKIILPNTIKNIGTSAFYSCTELTSIVIPDGITELESTTFSGCKNLQDIVLPSTLQTLGESVFLSCENLKNIDLKNVTSIGSSCFQNCSNLVSIKMPNVTTIEENAFYVCRELKEIDFSNNLSFVGKQAFYDCENLTTHCCDNSYYLGDNNNQHLILMKISNKQIDNYNVNDDCKIIYDEVFKECENLTEVTLPSGLIHIGDHAFASCSNLSEIDIPDTVKSIGMYSFAYCTSLKNIKLSESLQTIDYSGFYGSHNIESIVIYNNITEIGKQALKCDKLRTIYYYGTAEEWGEISILENNTGILNSTIYYYLSTEPTTEGNYWHFDTDGATPIIWGATE